VKQWAHLTKPGWSKPHTHSNPTNLPLFRHKITLYRFNQGRGLILLQEGAQMGAEGLSPLDTPHFNHWCSPGVNSGALGRSSCGFRGWENVERIDLIVLVAGCRKSRLKLCLFNTNSYSRFLLSVFLMFARVVLIALRLSWCSLFMLEMSSAIDNQPPLPPPPSHTTNNHNITTTTTTTTAAAAAAATTTATATTATRILLLLTCRRRGNRDVRSV